MVLSGTHIIPVCFHRHFAPIFLFSEVSVRYVAKCNRRHYQFFFLSQGIPKWTGFLEGVVNWLPGVRRNLAAFPVVPCFTFVDLVRCNVNPLAGEEHMKELIQQLQLMGEVCTCMYMYLRSVSW